MQQLLYVSKSRVNARITGLIIPEMVSCAREKNERLGITGALIFTGTHFAQVLEGRKETIGDLMSSISIDPRHEYVTILRELSVKERQFADWCMAYHGPSQSVSNCAASFVLLAKKTEQLKRADELVALAAISSSRQSQLAHWL